MSSVCCHSSNADSSKARVSTFGPIASHIATKKRGQAAHVRNDTSTPVTRIVLRSSW
ncbi:hypothetical protein [Myxococcus faecalis]|uniref:hypothetical protein n=1 Tax=Myxococcus faecalis TaxID=3115646 RepID=UPI003CFBA4CA